MLRFENKFNHMQVMPIVLDDGGREEAGFTGQTRDCVCRAFAIASGKSYQEVYALINKLAAKERVGKRKSGKSSARSGVYKPTCRKVGSALGGIWYPTMKIGQGCKVHLRSDELPSGRLVVSVSKHLTAVIDGVCHDTDDHCRAGTRCVYGYWLFE